MTHSYHEYEFKTPITETHLVENQDVTITDIAVDILKITITEVGDTIETTHMEFTMYLN